MLRPAAAQADDDCAAPATVLGAGTDLGLPILGVPEALGGISEERSAMTGTLVAEALAHGDLGLAVAALSPGAVATAIGLWGTEQQQATYLPAFTGDDVPAAALALNEPTVLFDALEPATSAVRDGDELVLDGVKSLVTRGAEAELFVVGARLDGQPVLVLVEAGAAGLSVEGDPAMGVRASSATRLSLQGVRVPADAVLGEADGSTYRECVQLSRLAWCALAVGTGQAAFDYAKAYCSERVAFGEPIVYRQSVAFMIANIAIELRWSCACWCCVLGESGQQQGLGFRREAALVRACTLRTRRCRSEPTACSCSVARASSRNTRSSFGTGSCARSRSSKARFRSEEGAMINLEDSAAGLEPADRAGPPGRSCTCSDPSSRKYDLAEHEEPKELRMLGAHDARC